MMSKRRKRLGTALLSCIMLLSCFAGVTAFAEESGTYANAAPARQTAQETEDKAARKDGKTTSREEKYAGFATGGHYYRGKFSRR
ncbi:MAG TPA: hypothetical protein IAD32_04130 [Candidatus Scatavimonas merdigallinarum]|uniref:Uncharacterized protein n=1 Tax=Candidatus Scatavimonas merdigallinarum TaxID=2840914 RepID=A0A9D0ZHG9_9FIRM|nr:hypothetical protein [Candidatus Scatavimonas merdigallinarum]